MIAYWRIPLHLTLKSPWVTPGSKAAGIETDIRLARDEQDRLILPSSLVKGTLLGALKWLAAEYPDITLHDGQLLKEMQRLAFGQKSEESSEVEVLAPERGALIFGDLTISVADQEAERSSNIGALERRTVRVEIDDELGSAKEAHLQFVEAPLGIGREVAFEGEVILKSNANIKPEIAVELLKTLSDQLVAIGGMKSVGFGSICKSKVGDPSPVSAAEVRSPASSVSLTYRVDRPFIVDPTAKSPNLIAGAEEIPGTAIKAVIAEGLKAVGRYKEYSEQLSKLCVSSARPLVPGGTGRLPVPLSLSVCDDKLFHRVGNEPVIGHHRFTPDWKGNETKDVRKALCRVRAQYDFSDVEINFRARTRTAIDSISGGSLFDGDSGGALFSEISVVASCDAGPAWSGSLVADGADGIPEILLGLLASGIPGLGKTGAVLFGDDAAPLTVPDASEIDREFDLMLVSDAVMFPVEDIREKTNTFDLYHSYFGQIGLELKHHHARQRLIGGSSKLGFDCHGAGYQPWVATVPGSMFRVKAKPESDLEDLLLRGLPPHNPRNLGWQHFPFLRENGFGQVIVNPIPKNALKDGVSLRCSEPT